MPPLERIFEISINVAQEGQTKLIEVLKLLLLK